MKVTVTQEFRDKNNYATVYGVGNVYEFEEARAKNIIARGLGVEVKPEKPKKVVKKTDDE